MVRLSLFDRFCWVVHFSYWFSLCSDSDASLGWRVYPFVEECLGRMCIVVIRRFGIDRSNVDCRLVSGVVRIYSWPKVGLNLPVLLTNRTKWGVALSEVRIYEIEVAPRPMAFASIWRSRRYWGQSNTLRTYHEYFKIRARQAVGCVSDIDNLSIDLWIV